MRPSTAGRSAKTSSTSFAARASSIAPTTAIASAARVMSRFASAGRSSRVDRGEALGRAVGRQRIGMAGKDARAPGAAGDRAGLVGLVADLGEQLLAHARRRRLVEARRVDREPQQFAGAVEMARQRLHPSADVVALGMEGELDRLLVERLLEGLVVEIARAFVEQAGEHASARRPCRRGPATRRRGRRIRAPPAAPRSLRPARSARRAELTRSRRLTALDATGLETGMFISVSSGAPAFTPAAALGRRLQAAVGCSVGSR